MLIKNNVFLDFTAFVFAMPHPYLYFLEYTMFMFK